MERQAAQRTSAAERAFRMQIAQFLAARSGKRSAYRRYLQQLRLVSIAFQQVE
jgi:hypothetical protein